MKIILTTVSRFCFLGLVSFSCVQASAQNKCVSLFQETRVVNAATFKQKYLQPALNFILKELPRQTEAASILPQFEFGRKKDTSSDNAQIGPDLIYALKPGTRYDRANEIDVDRIVETEINFTGHDWNDFNRGRIVFFKGDVYTANSYKNFAHGKRLTGEAFKQFIKSRAWLERIKGPDGLPTYKLHQYHAGRRILEQLIAETSEQSIHLYRGTYLGEVLLFEVIQQLKNGEMPSSEKLKSLSKTISEKFGKNVIVNKRMVEIAKSVNDLMRLQTADPQLLSDYSDRLMFFYTHATSKMFFSASRDRASLFSKGQLMMLKIDKQQLLSLYDAGLLYVGIEGQIEIAFFDQSINYLSQAKISAVADNSENGGFMESDYFEPLFLK